MMTLIYILTSAVIAGLLVYIFINSRQKSFFVERNAYDEINKKYGELTTALAVEEQKVQTAAEKLKEKEDEFKIALNEQKDFLGKAEDKFGKINQQLIDANSDKAIAIATHEASLKTIKTHEDTIGDFKKDVLEKSGLLSEAGQKVAELNANLTTANDKLATQKSEMDAIHKQFNLEFENIASKILTEKSDKFTKLNQDNLTAILKPLGDNLDIFKKKVEDVYDKESKERFSLGKEVEKLVQLNQKISEEANNLTNALKGNSKTQGDWGQMILENILEKCGLVKDREYFVQEFLKDDAGNYHKNEEGTKMQPDVIIAYPDNRKVIIDSKVSLIAYTRYIATDSVLDQQIATDEHLKSIRKHVDDLSKKSYQDFAPSLDFVMMFIPNEPAYFLALQKDPELWHYAYNKRVILISPTNLVMALKLIGNSGVTAPL